MAKKYIDTDKLKEFVGELKKRAERNCCDTWGIVPDALEEVEGFIISHQQEQLDKYEAALEKAREWMPKVNQGGHAILIDIFSELGEGLDPRYGGRKQEQPDTCIFGNTPSEEACKFCGVDCELREPKQSGITSTNLSSTNEAVGLAIMAYLDTKVKHDNAKVCGVSLRAAREWIREKIANKQEQPTKGYDEAYLNECIAKASKTWKGVDTDKYMDEVRGRDPEQPEVDLEKELDKYLRGEFKQTAGGNFNNYIQVARHFFGLGLNARKEK